MNQENFTPTDVFNAFMIARRSGDIEAVKNTLTKSALDIVEGISIAEGKPFNEALNTFGLGQKLFGLYDSEKLPETRNETITGGLAYIEVKNFVSGEFQNFTFLKENGVWKLALDVEVVQEEQTLSDILGMLFSHLKNVFAAFVRSKIR